MMFTRNTYYYNEINTYVCSFNTVFNNNNLAF